MSRAGSLAELGEGDDVSDGHPATIEHCSAGRQGLVKSGLTPWVRAVVAALRQRGRHVSVLGQDSLGRESLLTVGQDGMAFGKAN